MKKSLLVTGKCLILTTLTCGISSLDCSAQGIINNGSKISLVSGAHMIISYGGFTNETSGSVVNAGTIYLDGNWENHDSGGVFGAAPTPTTGGEVRLDGATQDITGTEETNFYDIRVEGSDKKTLDGIGSKVHGTLTLSSQSVILNTEILTLENASLGPAAISNSGGFLISETGPADGGYGVVKWKIPSSNTGSYTIPFGTEGATPDNIALGYNITTAGTPTSNYKTFSTYDTDSENSFTGPNITVNPTSGQWSNLPNTVNNLTDGYNQAAHYFVSDRFWIIDEDNLGEGNGGYSVKPEIEYVFKYLDAEVTGANHITEANLVPQRYNHTDDQWGDWQYGNPAVLTNTVANTVTVQIGSNASSWTEDMYPVWTLVDNSDPLPIELTAFEGSCSNGKIEISWTTWTETNNDFFTIERSNNGTEFETVDIIDAAGNSNEPIGYTALDDLPYGGTSYYRLQNTDFAGKAEYSEILAVSCGADDNDFSFTNAYDIDNHDFLVEFTASENENYTIKLLDASGRLILDSDGVGFGGMNKVKLNAGDLARGIYVINLSNGTQTFSKRVMLR